MSPPSLSEKVAEELLEKFDVTPKLAIPAKELGMLACEAAGWSSRPPDDVGARVLASLADKGLEIVRREERECAIPAWRIPNR